MVLRLWYFLVMELGNDEIQFITCGYNERMFIMLDIKKYQIKNYPSDLQLQNQQVAKDM
ncbi:hypothetical protein T11_11581 [Trichinella zimbabwensis]|uniref:Uncharacterized protein n=1 Tax=Trichinella zimbabwensis TaxID=268475 RepID=A0A0V1GLW2_9BILA|nr:hypothetical protein T11_11581 [Trichinella zimbabwensis]